MLMPRMSIFMIALVLSGCGWGDRDVTLTRIRHNGPGPDEFSILPGKPLQTPEDLSSLPAPAPGSVNLTDPNPKAEGIAALGGNSNAIAASAVSASDGGLVNHARRYGASPDIRQTLAAEDEDVRRRHGRVNILRLGPVDDYTNSYKKQWLDPYAEERRLRNRGIVTPTAPPED